MRTLSSPSYRRVPNSSCKRHSPGLGFNASTIELQTSFRSLRAFIFPLQKYQSNRAGIPLRSYFPKFIDPQRRQQVKLVLVSPPQMAAQRSWMSARTLFFPPALQPFRHNASSFFHPISTTGSPFEMRSFAYRSCLCIAPVVVLSSFHKYSLSPL